MWNVLLTLNLLSCHDFSFHFLEKKQNSIDFFYWFTHLLTYLQSQLCFDVTEESYFGPWTTERFYISASKQHWWLEHLLESIYCWFVVVVVNYHICSLTFDVQKSPEISPYFVSTKQICHKYKLLTVVLNWMVSYSLRCSL